MNALVVLRDAGPLSLIACAEISLWLNSLRTALSVRRFSDMTVDDMVLCRGRLVLYYFIFLRLGRGNLGEVSNYVDERDESGDEKPKTHCT
jgi:hypothetical protein